MALKIKPQNSCQFDLIALGEVMLRLDPLLSPVRYAKSFDCCEGGGEYNVARGLRANFNLRTAIVTSLVDNEVGHLLEDLILHSGVNSHLIRWRDEDSQLRNGVNFTERGYGQRAAHGVSDRGHTAAMNMQPGDVDWHYIFGKCGCRWFHTGGIFTGLSDSTAQLTIEACKIAQQYGTIVSFDLNYRHSLWRDRGGFEAHENLCNKIAKNVDVLIGDDSHYQDFQACAATKRTVHTACSNDWYAVSYHQGKRCESTHLDKLEILDRVGGGDSFAAGLIYGFMKYNDPAKAVEFGTAHGAIAMTTPGDTTTATIPEVKKIVAGKPARIEN